MKKLFLFVFIFSSISFVFSQTYYLNINLKDGTKVRYEVEDINKIDFSDITGIENAEKMQAIIKSFKLRQNYPNPFNPSTTIEYELPKTGKVEVSIFDMNGRLVKNIVNQSQPAGSHKVVWNGQSRSGQKVASGFYVYMVKFGKSVSAKKMLFIK